MQNKKTNEIKTKNLLINYQKEFAWLEIREGTKLYCKYCIRYCVNNQITEFGHEKDYLFIKEGSVHHKKDNLKKHEQRSLHQKGAFNYGTEEERKKEY